MNAVMHFLAMGGYAGFVWPAYGVASLVLAWMLVDSIGAYRRVSRELQSLEREKAPR
jgi:heme exporter protein D